MSETEVKALVHSLLEGEGGGAGVLKNFTELTRILNVPFPREKSTLPFQFFATIKEAAFEFLPHQTSYKHRKLWLGLENLLRADNDKYGCGQAGQVDVNRVLVTGLGPVGVRTAIELARMNIDVTVTEKYPADSFDSRLNVLKLWPWVFGDLKALGVNTKLMRGKGNKHIGTRELQLSLLRTSLLLGVRVHVNTEYMHSEIDGRGGWRAVVQDRTTKEPWHVGFDVAIGAGGSRDKIAAELNFPTKVIKCADAVGMVGTFEKMDTLTERKLEEVLWARQFNYPPLADKMKAANVSLENLVYAQASCHYIVMTPTRSSLVARGVLPDKTAPLTAADTDKLLDYARAAATCIGIPETCPPVGRRPAAIFDFSERMERGTAALLFQTPPDAPENQEQGLALLVGDALQEPFWPEGLGINRGFLSALDAAWTVAHFRKVNTEDLLEARDSLFNAQKQLNGFNHEEVLQESEDVDKHLVAFEEAPESRYTKTVFKAPKLAPPTASQLTRRRRRTTVSKRTSVKSGGAVPTSAAATPAAAAAATPAAAASAKAETAPAKETPKPAIKAEPPTVEASVPVKKLSISERSASFTANSTAAAESEKRTPGKVSSRVLAAQQVMLGGSDKVEPVKSVAKPPAAVAPTTAPVEKAVETATESAVASSSPAAEVKEAAPAMEATPLATETPAAEEKGEAESTAKEEEETPSVLQEAHTRKSQIEMFLRKQMAEYETASEDGDAEEDNDDELMEEESYDEEDESESEEEEEMEEGNTRNLSVSRARGMSVEDFMRLRTHSLNQLEKIGRKSSFKVVATSVMRLSMLARKNGVTCREITTRMVVDEELGHIEFSIIPISQLAWKSVAGEETDDVPAVETPVAQTPLFGACASFAYHPEEAAAVEESSEPEGKPDGEEVPSEEAAAVEESSEPEGKPDGEEVPSEEAAAVEESSEPEGKPEEAKEVPGKVCITERMKALMTESEEASPKTPKPEVKESLASRINSLGWA
ncbi:hypothetical protein CYMTET_26582 [Cymbomonas tetramitiformis]|uniref:[F-actin]-monooxygenase MICAL1-3-like Rossman domain-containing protein n=1 Tax=Cymbomonas tetramitiformis TaxID=36881 RepID=A0AAE0FS21_9CHLO|nr:hypothetical protein CYMTET_26582 [Cymbomonas tetramitiformis]